MFMTVESGCAGLFVSTNNDLYCSIWNRHKVVKKSLNDNVDQSITIAGNGSPASNTNTLNHPRGIFVDQFFNLYVADCYNNRIQLFKSGQSNGITININGIYEIITLKLPTGVVLDYDGFLFIVDNGNHRILRENKYGFICLIACSKSIGSDQNHLHYPFTMAFDYHGNIFITDQNNHRIQLFLFKQNSCG